MIAARVERATAEAGGNAADPEAVGRRTNVRPEPAQLLDHRFDPIRLLHAELGRPRDDGLAARMARGEGEQRQLVDERGDLGRRHRRADELRRAHLDVPRRLPADRASVVDRDPRTHALEHVEQTRSDAG